MARRFAVWNGVSIAPEYRSLYDIHRVIQSLKPRTGASPWSLEWIVKAGEGGSWQSQFDGHRLAIDGAAKLQELRRLGRQMTPRMEVTPYFVVRGRPDWQEEEHAQIIAAAAVSGRVILNVEPGRHYWNGPTDQANLQDGWLRPLRVAMLAANPRCKVEVAYIPREWVVRDLGGLPCLAAWMANSDAMSWECYDALADDLRVEDALARVDRWSNEVGWGQKIQYRIPIVNRSRIGAWAETGYARNGLEVWHLDGD